MYFVVKKKYGTFGTPPSNVMQKLGYPTPPIIKLFLGFKKRPIHMDWNKEGLVVSISSTPNSK